MQDNYHFLRYIPGDSKIHMMNSKMKTIWLILAIISCVLLRNSMSMLIFFAFVIFIMLNVKISLKYYVIDVLNAWFLYLLTFLITYIFTFNLGMSLFMSLKALMLMLLFIIFTFTTSLSEIAWGNECLFQRLKKIDIPVTKISLKIAMILKFLSTLFEERKIVRKSMVYRGFPIKRMSLKYMIILPISLSLRHVKTVENVMKVRFYGKAKRRTNYHDYKITRFDKVIVVLTIALVYVIIYTGWFL